MEGLPGLKPMAGLSQARAWVVPGQLSNAVAIGRAWLLRGVTSSRLVETAPRTGGPVES